MKNAARLITILPSVWLTELARAEMKSIISKLRNNTPISKVKIPANFSRQLVVCIGVQNNKGIHFLQQFVKVEALINNGKNSGMQ